MTIARIKISEGNEHSPTIIKMQFTPEVWNIVIGSSFTIARYSNMSEEEARAFEVREAITRTCNLIDRELREAFRDQLGVNL